ncbi:hypothetical protein QBC46DRAFT_388960 [Diplogelasinospora grovesii]|uniref:DUF7730 domain-containing protein n=1 Tax=Diplogelasinospora grovesii TaxID=303347 RepID=A0AAN6S410_9PEZI|nr:hypothetical protein QBC46DRAFT_388960 [Diplogelasinospora grovesii]
MESRGDDSAAQAAQHHGEGEPGRAALSSSADPQLASRLFSVLPAEVRRFIYSELWVSYNPRQHILQVALGPGSQNLSHRICFQPGEDTRYADLVAATTAKSRTTYYSRLKSDWCLHYMCEELQRQRKAVKKYLGWSCPPFIATLLTCKRMYLECIESIYENLTFIFTDLVTAGAFLDPTLYPFRVASVRSIELCIRFTNLLPELYFPDASVVVGPQPGHPNSKPVSMDNNPWQRVCDALKECQKLRDLHIWLDTKDLRPWSQRVHEMRMFRPLFDVKTSGRFVLALPEPPRPRASANGGGGGGQGAGGGDGGGAGGAGGAEGEGARTRGRILDDGYLTEEHLKDAPFTVERGPRPNNWRVHLTMMNNQLEGRRAPQMPLLIGPP